MKPNSETDSMTRCPLHTTVDSDALDTLLAPHTSAVGDSHVTFEYSGCEVTASSYGSLTVTPLEASPSPQAADD